MECSAWLEAKLLCWQPKQNSPVSLILPVLHPTSTFLMLPCAQGWGHHALYCSHREMGYAV